MPCRTTHIRGLRKNAHGQLFKEGLALTFAGIAQQATDFLPARRAKTDFEIGYQVSLAKGKLAFGNSLFIAEPWLQADHLRFFLILRKKRQQQSFAHVERWRNGSEGKVVRLG